MKPYIEKLKTYLAEHPPDYGDCDARSVLEMLYTYYSQYNRLDTPQIKSDFETLYHQLTGKSLRELDNIIDTVTTLCWHHEKSGFTEGIKLGILLATELAEESKILLHTDGVRYGEQPIPQIRSLRSSSHRQKSSEQSETAKGV